mmetsp:Transcript_38588/g.54307  ORF Transcript_38588/g.54307 Transcript_38588/m.54307 type:complete len:128 (+) Transcript_38588:356-739(+)
MCASKAFGPDTNITQCVFLFMFMLLLLFPHLVFINMRGNDFTNEQRPDSRGTSVIEHVIGAEVLCSEEFSHGENDHGPHHPEGEAAHSNAQDKECFGDGREGEDEMREAAEGAGYEEDDGSGGDVYF